MNARAKLVLAVAGARKTQSIVDACASSDATQRILILTYTTANQAELRTRLSSVVGNRSNIEVMGWFAFLITHIVRPFVPYGFYGYRVRGFDFESPPQRGTSTTSPERYFNQKGQVRKVHLSQLAHVVESASTGAGLRRLKRLYDKIYIDEVQDLCGYDLEVLRMLIDSEMNLEMVGDVRQAVFVTNEREQKNSQFKYMKVWEWFKIQERKGRIEIAQSCETWRCRPEIAAFADSLFDSALGFDATKSLNQTSTEHDGLFLVKKKHVGAYLECFQPLLLRYSKATCKDLPYEFMNFKIAKGLSRRRVLVCPTSDIKQFLMGNKHLTSQQAAELYVAVTRAEQSVAFLLDSPGSCHLQYWSPNDEDTDPRPATHESESVSTHTPSLFD